MTILRHPVNIRALAEQAKAIGGVDMAQGIIDAPAPDFLVSIMQSLPLQDISRYNNMRGVPAYREAVQAYLAKRGWNVPVDAIAGVAGAMAGFTSLLLTHCRPGDAVLLPEPFFQGHNHLLTVLGFKPVYYSTAIGKPIKWQEVGERFSEVAAAIITTPTNPSGQVASIDDMTSLIAAGKRDNCFVIFDEMYREFIWNEEIRDDSSHASLDLSQAAIIRSWSKTLAIPGWRVGWLITNSKYLDEVMRHHDPIFAGGSTIAQHALTIALTEHSGELENFVSELRNLCQENLKTLANVFSTSNMQAIIPDATYYMLLKHNRESDQAALQELLEKKLVVSPGQAFFSDQTKDTGYIRIHVAISPTKRRQVVAALS